MASNFIKGPGEVLDYQFNWIQALESGETISSHTVTTSAAALVVDSSAESGGRVTAWLSGGAADSTYTATCQVVTSSGRTMERSIMVQVKVR